MEKQKGGSNANAVLLLLIILVSGYVLWHYFAYGNLNFDFLL